MMRWDLLSFLILPPCCLSTERKITDSLAKGPEHPKAGQVALASDRELCPFPPLHGTHTQQSPRWSLWMWVCRQRSLSRASELSKVRAWGNVKDPICYFQLVAWVSKGHVCPGLEWELTRSSDQEAGTTLSPSRFLINLGSTDVLSQIILCWGCGGCPVHCWMVSSIPGV